MCQKGYARMNEYQAHESSYDHSHRMVRPSYHPVDSSKTIPKPKLISTNNSASKK